MSNARHYKNVIFGLPQQDIEFLTWFGDEFLRRNGGFAPSAIFRWLKNVRRSHEELVGIFGKDIIHTPVSIKKIDDSITKAEIQSIIKEINENLPDFLSTLGHLLKRGVVLTEEALMTGVVPNGTHNVFKLSPLLSKAIDQYKKAGILGGSSSLVWSRKMNKLASLWNAVKSIDEDFSVEVTMSCTPKSFALIAHYGPDKDSCFRQGSLNNRDNQKYILGQTKNTFVITISRFIPELEKTKNVARILGYYDSDTKAISVFNYYFNKYITEHYTKIILTKAISDIWKDEYFIVPRDLLYKPDYFYINPYFCLTFWPKNKLINKDIVEVPFDYSYLAYGLSHHCERCGCQMRDINSCWVDVDDAVVCPNCLCSANKCELSELSTFQQLVDFDNGNQDLSIHPCLTKLFNQCMSCGKLIGFANEPCRECKGNTYNYCDCCGSLLHEDLLNNADGLDICDNCLIESNITLSNTLSQLEIE